MLFSGFSQPGDIHTAFDIPRGVDAEEWLQMRERKSINHILYAKYPSTEEIDSAASQAEMDVFNINEQDLLAVALGAPARQVMLRAEEIGLQTGWRDGYLSMDHGFCPPDYNEAAGALARSPRRVWSDLCERMPGCVSRGRVRESIAAATLVEGKEDVIPDQALWAALVALGMLCSIYRFEEKYDGHDSVNATKSPTKLSLNCKMGDHLGEELVGIPLSIALPYYQSSRRMGRTLPHLTFVDQSSYNLKVKDATSSYPYVARFDNIELRWPMVSERAEVAYLKGVAKTSVSFQHGPDAIAACQEHVMNRIIEGLLHEMIRLKEILERMPNAFHPISTNPNAGVHLRAWLPSNLRAFIAAIEYHYRIPEFVQQSGDPPTPLMGVLDGIVEAYTGKRGFMGFSEAMKERLEPYRGTLPVEPHQMRGTSEECRYVSRVASRSFVDYDPSRSITMVTLDIRDTGITFAPGDRLAVMPLNNWGECAKVIAALGLEGYIDAPVEVKGTWARFEMHLGSVRRTTTRKLTVGDILRRGHLAPITQDMALKIQSMLHASFNTVFQVLGTDEWPVRGSLGDLLQDAVTDTPPQIWDKVFKLDELSWLAELIPLEVPRNYSIASYTQELLPETVDLAMSRSEYKLCSTFSRGKESWKTSRMDDEILIGVSRPAAFQRPLDPMAPCAFFAGGSGIALFWSLWPARLAQSGLSGGKNLLYLGIQSREKFCFEDELRQYVDADFMEVHVAFSRDSRGLVCAGRDLIEKHTPPRYIDSLIIEQGVIICDFVMSKKQGGLGGYLYVCGSLAVFDSVMSGIRKAIYTYRTATEKSVDFIINKAFAERRFMLDIFMTPKPLPCTLPTIPLSQLALHTGHRPGSRMWIGVHGSVYDVTDFCPMHPGGTLIIKSNAGVDCSKSFDNLAHTNNPEVSSLLTKYFVGHLTSKPDYGSVEISALHDLWAAYLRTTVETLVAHQFEMYEIMGASLKTSSSHDPAGSNNIWFRESLPNIIAVRTLYSYQSRLLQGGFAALFGPKLQELVLKLSFNVASADRPAADTKLPDVLGNVARAKTSQEAAICTKEIALVSQFVCDAEESLRFHIELDIALLEDLRQEACNGMDAFGNIAGTTKDYSDPDAESTRLTVLSMFLLQALERMARHLESFYIQLARCAVYQPQLESNPARTRWAFVRRRIRDESLFVLATKAELGSGMLEQTAAAPYYMSRANPNLNIEIDHVMAQQPLTLNAVHQARGQSTGDVSAVASRENAGALRAMNSFVEKNSRAIRRLSKMPAVALSFENILRAALLEMSQGGSGAVSPTEMAGDVGSSAEHMPKLGKNANGGCRILPTPPSSRGSNRSPTRFRYQLAMSQSHAPYGKHAADMLLSKLNPPRRASLSRGVPSVHHFPAPFPAIGSPSQLPSHPAIDAQTALNAMMSRLNTRPRSGSATVSANNQVQSPTYRGLGRSRSVTSLRSAGVIAGRDRGG
ncbi:NADPH oxidoreductase A [Colletotrichum chlorophyti]|uniref:NADPH--hemoprotein reductase n=1 Tax=Colletotrichum chlorophyti TaxID=708187 RepID=A0A1Q8RMP7_9PEZI|nr:NADPH oxidoreductase A [Colletotrichum chlorophyti]